MLDYKKYQLDNGLRLIVHEDPETPMAIVNVLYDVGSRDETEAKTGFAHLFEHLMFEGSINIENFDEHVHLAGGECNAFTSSDMTNYYIMLPAHNVETAFWLESDRMLSLGFGQDSLDVQKGVVCEEFKEHYINQPYGDWLHRLRKLSYTTHPYKWPVIGKDLSHIENATLEDVKTFFYTHYRPNNAILCVAGNVQSEQVFSLAQKWFGDIAPGPKHERMLPAEPPQAAFRAEYVKANVPLDAIYMGFHVPARLDPDFYPMNVICEVLSGGASGRIYQALVKERRVFSSISASNWEYTDSGLLYVSGKVQEGISIEAAEVAIWEELEKLKSELITEEELCKIINKIEANIQFNEVSLRDKAFSLAYFELLGRIDDVNYEIERYLAVSRADVQRVAQQIFNRQNCSVIYYKADKNAAGNAGFSDD